MSLCRRAGSRTDSSVYHYSWRLSVVKFVLLRELARLIHG